METASVSPLDMSNKKRGEQEQLTAHTVMPPAQVLCVSHEPMLLRFEWRSFCCLCLNNFGKALS